MFLIYIFFNKRKKQAYINQLGFEILLSFSIWWRWHQELRYLWKYKRFAFSDSDLGSKGITLVLFPIEFYSFSRLRNRSNS